MNRKVQMSITASGAHFFANNYVNKNRKTIDIVLNSV